MTLDGSLVMPLGLLGADKFVARIPLHLRLFFIDRTRARVNVRFFFYYFIFQGTFQNVFPLGKTQCVLCDQKELEWQWDVCLRHVTYVKSDIFFTGISNFCHADEI